MGEKGLPLAITLRLSLRGRGSDDAEHYKLCNAASGGRGQARILVTGGREFADEDLTPADR